MGRINKFVARLGILSFIRYLVVADGAAALLGYVVFKHVFLIGSLINLVFVLGFTLALIRYWVWCRINY